MTLAPALRDAVAWYGGLALLSVQVARNLALPPSYLELVARQIDIIGVRSTGVALVAALFTGMVLALQTAVNMARFGAEVAVDAVSVKGEGCVYDLLYVAPVEAFEAGRGDFQAFVESLSFSSRATR